MRKFICFSLAALVFVAVLGAMQSAEADGSKEQCRWTNIGGNGEYKCSGNLAKDQHITLLQPSGSIFITVACNIFGFCENYWTNCHADVNSVTNNVANVTISHDVKNCPWGNGTTFNIFWYI